MAARALLTVNEYLSKDYSPDCDYVEGQIEERNVGEWDHSRLQGLLSSYLIRRERDWGIIVAIEQRVRISEMRYRIPDILVLQEPPTEQIIVTPPLICIEILSPEDRVTRMQVKVEDYVRFGVKYVWVIDPKTRQAFAYNAEGVHEVKDGVLRTAGFAVPLKELGE